MAVVERAELITCGFISPARPIYILVLGFRIESVVSDRRSKLGGWTKSTCEAQRRAFAGRLSDIGEALRSLVLRPPARVREARCGMSELCGDGTPRSQISVDSQDRMGA
jgi:hypothetical protein